MSNIPRLQQRIKFPNATRLEVDGKRSFGRTHSDHELAQAEHLSCCLPRWPNANERMRKFLSPATHRSVLCTDDNISPVAFILSTTSVTGILRHCDGTGTYQML